MDQKDQSTPSLVIDALLGAVYDRLDIPYTQPFGSVFRVSLGESQ